LWLPTASRPAVSKTSARSSPTPPPVPAVADAAAAIRRRRRPVGVPPGFPCRPPPDTLTRTPGAAAPPAPPGCGRHSPGTNRHAQVVDGADRVGGAQSRVLEHLHRAGGERALEEALELGVSKRHVPAAGPTPTAAAAAAAPASAASAASTTTRRRRGRRRRRPPVEVSEHPEDSDEPHVYSVVSAAPLGGRAPPQPPPSLPGVGCVRGGTEKLKSARRVACDVRVVSLRVLHAITQRLF